MAIDTQTKRRSVQAYTFGLMRPVADGTVGDGDRATVTWLYSGLSYSPPPPITGSANPTGYIVYCGRMMNRGGSSS